MSLTGCKWSSWNAPGLYPLSPILVLFKVLKKRLSFAPVSVRDTASQIEVVRFLKIRNCESRFLLPPREGIELKGIDSSKELIPSDESISIKELIPIDESIPRGEPIQ